MIPETSNIFTCLAQGVKKAIYVLSVPRYFSHFENQSHIKVLRIPKVRDNREQYCM